VDVIFAGWLLEHLAVNAKVHGTVLGSMPASSDTVESEGRQMTQKIICLAINEPLKISGAHL
jgi:hypothetical protein